jgi:glycosyltransferase involved in cell wall biosynthesis
MKPSGGTELLYNNLIKHVGKDWLKDTNLVVSICNSQFVNPNQTNVLWQHLSYDQYNMQLMNDINFVNSIQHFVYVSEWQLNEYQKRFPISQANNHVIRNAIEPIEFKEKPKNKIKLIYTSMPNRGLEVLLDAFEIMDRNDVELTIYSSTIIYGKDYRDDKAQALFNRAKTMKNVIYKGYAMNAAVRKALQEHHILAYPSIFEETSCLAAIEAGAAGCKIVTTNYGALPETCSDWATHIDYTDNKKELAGKYAEVLNKTIDNYWDECYNIENQSNWFNTTYSWQNRAIEWKSFLDKICVK